MICAGLKYAGYGAAVSLLAMTAISHAAAEDVILDVTARGDHARLIIGANQKLGYSADLFGNVLTIKFAHKLTGDFSAPVARAPSFFNAAHHEDKTATLIFTMAEGVTLSTSQSENVIAIDVFSPDYRGLSRSIITARDMLRHRTRAFFLNHTPSVNPGRAAQPGLIADAESSPALMTLAALQLQENVEPPAAAPAAAQPANPEFDPAIAFETYRVRVRSEGFAAVEGEMLSALAASGAGTHTGALRNMVYFYMAHGLYPEALTHIRDGNQKTARPEFLLLDGIANYEMGRWDDAVKALASEPLEGNAEAASWRGMANARRGAYKAAAADILDNSATMVPTGDDAVEYYLSQTATAIAMEKPDVARKALAAMRRRSVTNPQRAERNLLEARLLLLEGRRPPAADIFAQLSETGQAPYSHMAALELLELNLQSGEIAAPKALNNIDKTLLTWSGGAFEQQALRLRATVLDQMGDIEGAFDTRRRLANAYPETDNAGEALQMMAHDMHGLFEGRKIPPMVAARIFYENIDLAPPGRDGDDLIRNVADDLAALDLLKQAAELLDHQVFHRLRGADRSAAAADLAALYLADQRPKAALKTVRSTRLARLPEALNQRRRLLEAQALVQLNDGFAALRLLETDQSVDASVLRGDIHWAASEWRLAAEAYAASLSEEKTRAPFTKNEVSRVLKAASAYVLASDDAALAAFKDAVQSRIEDPAGRSIFNELTSERFSVQSPAFFSAYQEYFNPALADG